MVSLNLLCRRRISAFHFSSVSACATIKGSSLTGLPKPYRTCHSVLPSTSGRRAVQSEAQEVLQAKTAQKDPEPVQKPTSTSVESLGQVQLSQVMLPTMSPEPLTATHMGVAEPQTLRDFPSRRPLAKPSYTVSTQRLLPPRPGGGNGGQPASAEGAAPAASAGTTAETQQPAPRGVPVYVMLPLDMVDAGGNFKGRPWFDYALSALRDQGVHGVATDVWWGAVEQGVEQYRWSGYRELFDKIRSYNLKVQVVMSFHSCGGNVGDDVNISLPRFVDEAIGKTAGFYYRGVTRELKQYLPENKEYISLFADLLECIPGAGGQMRTPIQCYADFMRSFRDEFVYDLGNFIEEVVVGTGPCGELRYPSYVEDHGWRFPGVGEFQTQGCYAKQSFGSYVEERAADCEAEAEAAGLEEDQRQALRERAATIRSFLTRPEQPESGAGNYNSRPQETQFFNETFGTWRNEMESLFLEWYHGALIGHGARVLDAATAIFATKYKPKTLPPEGKPVPIPTTQSSRQPPESPQRAPPALQSGPVPAADGDDAPQPRINAEDGERPQSTAQDGVTQGRGPQEEGRQGSGPAPTERRRVGSRLQRIPSVPKPLQVDTPRGGLVEVTLKVAGIHWYYNHPSHAAELTAGYYNTQTRNGYRQIVELCARRGVAMTLTCVEMRDQDHPPEAFCSPRRLIRLVRETCSEYGVALGGENALPCFHPGQVNVPALSRIVEHTDAWVSPLQMELLKGRDSEPTGEKIPLPYDTNEEGSLSNIPNRSQDPPRQALLPAMRSFTFLRLTDQMVSDPFQADWQDFVSKMKINGEGRPFPEWGKPEPPSINGSMH